MKKVLLGTTALLAAGMFAGPALGQARTPMTATNFNLTLGGYTQFRVEYQSKSPVQDVTTVDAYGNLTNQPRKDNFDFDAELEFRGAATLSNGVKMGWELELEAGGQELLDLSAATGTTGGTTVADADIIDDNFMYVQGRWGKVTMGGFSVTSLDIGVARTFTGAGAIDLNDAAGDAVAVAGTNRASFTNSLQINNGRNRIEYAPPSIAGFRFLLAYAPDLDGGENSVRATERDDVNAQDRDIYAATQWAGAVMGNKLRVSAAWATTRPETKTPSAAATDPTAVQISSNNRWRLGADIELLGFTIGAYYRDQIRNAANVAVDEAMDTYGIGATYQLGVWEFGAALEKAKTEQRTALVAGGTGGDLLGDDKATRWDIGVNYTGLGAGKTIRLGMRKETWKDDQANPDNEAKNRSIDLRYEWDVGPGLEFDVGYQNYRYTHHVGLDATDTQDQRTAHGIFVQTKLTF